MTSELNKRTNELLEEIKLRKERQQKIEMILEKAEPLVRRNERRVYWRDLYGNDEKVLKEYRSDLDKFLYEQIFLTDELDKKIDKLYEFFGRLDAEEPEQVEEKNRIPVLDGPIYNFSTPEAPKGPVILEPNIFDIGRD